MCLVLLVYSYFDQVVFCEKDLSSFSLSFINKNLSLFLIKKYSKGTEIFFNKKQNNVIMKGSQLHERTRSPFRWIIKKSRYRKKKKTKRH